MPDETTEAGQDSPQAEPQSKDAPQTAPTPESQDGTTPEPMTTEAVKKLIREGKADAGRQIAEARRETESFRKEAAKQAAQFKSTLAELEALEERVSKDEPEGLDLLKLRREIREKRAELQAERDEFDQGKQEHTERISKVEKLERDYAALAVAADYPGVKPEDLIDLGGTDKASMTKIARILANPRTQPDTPKPDDSTGDRGGMSDDEKLKAYGRGELSDHAEIRKILEKR